MRWVTASPTRRGALLLGAAPLLVLALGYVIASVHDRRAEQRAEIQAMAPEAVVRRARLTRARRDPG